MVAHACNSSSWKAEAGRSQVCGLPRVHSKILPQPLPLQRRNFTCTESLQPFSIFTQRADGMLICFPWQERAPSLKSILLGLQSLCLCKSAPREIWVLGHLSHDLELEFTQQISTEHDFKGSCHVGSTSHFCLKRNAALQVEVTHLVTLQCHCSVPPCLHSGVLCMALGACGWWHIYRCLTQNGLASAQTPPWHAIDF